MDVFHEMTCLTERSNLLNGISLQKKWFKSADKRIIGQYLQKFIDYNSDKFDFIGVRPFIIGTDQNTSLAFRSSSYIGSIPLRASDTGKQIGDFVVTPKYSGRSRFEDYIEILNLLGKEISPESSDSLPLVSGRNFRPPLYLEAIKYIDAIEKLIRTSWRKFSVFEKVKNEPSGQVNWSKYITEQHKIEKSLSFPTRTNGLSEFHEEYSQLKYVFDLCKFELLSPETPLRIKSSIRSKLDFIESKLYNHDTKKISRISIKYSDSPIVKNCKIQANRILFFDFVESTAWRVDFSDVFEKFVQYIFNSVSKETGGKFYSNFKFHSRSKAHYSWELRHVEPDAIYSKDNLTVFIDAKYKSNLYNKFDQSDLLKEDHRHDLHQIMAYTSFTSISSKYGILCYPSEKLESKSTQFLNSANGVKNTVIIIGIPLKSNIVDEAKKMIFNLLNIIQKR